ncbi:c-type cytochrome [Fodinisporobacter ferrooxydans]|uniref:C-type cytochrome n=1 Tax=Fodinisporobacter ferrooxydans TaxID=2901836 RepID=A0ABY4CKK9_9BACL|nr:c-type cytochrome [Alicyclobacillaceae bacterium MYW30-H2]
MSADNSRERIPGVPRFKRDKTLPLGTEPFFPNFLLKEWIMGAVVLAGFIIWVIYNPVDLTPRANPDDSNFIPVPDWYFLFLYQLLKYFPGSVEVVGTVAVPLVSFLALLLVPWLDIKKNRRPGKRLATLSMVVAVVFMIWLTREAQVAYHMELAANPQALAELTAGASKDTGGSGGSSGKAAAGALVNTNDPGAKIFGQTCAGCHGADLKGAVGPKLLGIGKKFDEAKLEAIIKKGFPPNMPAGGTLTDPNQIKQVAHWLSQQKQ